MSCSGLTCRPQSCMHASKWAGGGLNSLEGRYTNSKLLKERFNPLNAELNPICHLLALLGGATIVVVSRLRVNNKPVGRTLLDKTQRNIRLLIAVLN